MKHFGLPSSKVQSEMFQSSALRKCGYMFWLNFSSLSPRVLVRVHRLKRWWLWMSLFPGDWVWWLEEQPRNPSMMSWKPIGHPSTGNFPDWVHTGTYTETGAAVLACLLFFFLSFFLFCELGDFCDTSTGWVRRAIATIHKKRLWCRILGSWTEGTSPSYPISSPVKP